MAKKKKNSNQETPTKMLSMITAILCLIKSIVDLIKSLL